jgi:hypothetical protein
MVVSGSRTTKNRQFAAGGFLGISRSTSLALASPDRRGRGKPEVEEEAGGEAVHVAKSYHKTVAPRTGAWRRALSGTMRA